MAEFDRMLNNFTVELKTVVAMALGDHVQMLSHWLRAVGDEKPERALKLWMELSEIVLPKMQRMEHTGKNGDVIAIEHSQSDEEVLQKFLDGCVTINPQK
jgi:hypothetical protein